MRDCVFNIAGVGTPCNPKFGVHDAPIFAMPQPEQSIVDKITQNSKDKLEEGKCKHMYKKGNGGPRKRIRNTFCQRARRGVPQSTPGRLHCGVRAGGSGCIAMRCGPPCLNCLHDGLLTQRVRASSAPAPPRASSPHAGHVLILLFMIPRKRARTHYTHMKCTLNGCELAPSTSSCATWSSPSSHTARRTRRASPPQRWSLRSALRH